MHIYSHEMIYSKCRLVVDSAESSEQIGVDKRISCMLSRNVASESHTILVICDKPR